MNHVCPEVQRKLKDQARDSLYQTLRVLAASPDSPQPNQELRVLTCPVADISQQDIFAFYVSWTSHHIPHTRMANTISSLEPKLREEIEDCTHTQDLSPERRSDRAVWLSSYLAGVFVPILAHLGQLSRAVGLALTLLKRFNDPDYRQVWGAGSEPIRDISFRHLALRPVVESFSVYHC